MEKRHDKVHGRRRAKLSEKRDQKDAQLWGESHFIKLKCKYHGWQKIPMLSPLVCPCCKRERRHSNLLRRSFEENSYREHQNHDPVEGVEDNGISPEATNGWTVRRDLL